MGAVHSEPISVHFLAIRSTMSPIAHRFRILLLGNVLPVLSNVSLYYQSQHIHYANEAVASGASLIGEPISVCLTCLYSFTSSFHSLDWKRRGAQCRKHGGEGSELEHWSVGETDANNTSSGKGWESIWHGMAGIKSAWVSLLYN